MTGGTDFEEVRVTLDRLSSPEADVSERIDVVTASSMMSHGVDIDRLNVMLVIGLPLTASEFIQATSRVGRTYPGLVIVLHKIARERDAAIFRSFPQFVAHGDRFVEPVAVTRRSRRVLQRTAAGLELARILTLYEPRSSQQLPKWEEFATSSKVTALMEQPKPKRLSPILGSTDHWTNCYVKRLPIGWNCSSKT